MFVVQINADIFTEDDLYLLQPITDNPNIFGYCTELKELLISRINKDTSDFSTIVGIDTLMNGQESQGLYLSLQMGFTIKLGNFLFTIPLLAGTKALGEESGAGGAMEPFLKEGTWLSATEGSFISSGLLFSGRYGQLGFIHDWFIYDSESLSRTNIYAQNIASEIPYLGSFLTMIDGYFSIDQFIESFSTNSDLDNFKPEYKVNILFRSIPLGKKAAITLSTFSTIDWYDSFSKFDMQGGRICFSFGYENDAFVFYSDIAYRRYFDVFLLDRYSEYKDGIYLKFGILKFTKDDGEFGFFNLYVESGKGALFSGIKIGLLAGFGTDSVSVKFSGSHYQPNYSPVPFNAAMSLFMDFLN